MSAWITYEGISVFRPAGKAYTYTTARMELDADGAPNAYHPADTGLDALANAGYPYGGWKSVLVTDPHDHSKPYVQPNGATAGYFLAMTTLGDDLSADTRPEKWVDATAIPYLVFPGAFNALVGTGGMGDLAMVKNVHDGKVCAAIVADLGNQNDPLGEVSIRLAEELGGVHPNPRTGAGKPQGPFRYVVFPYSHQTPKWPLTHDQLETLAEGLLDAAGGWAAFDNLS